MAALLPHIEFPQEWILISRTFSLAIPSPDQVSSKSWTEKITSTDAPAHFLGGMGEGFLTSTKDVDCRQALEAVCDPVGAHLFFMSRTLMYMEKAWGPQMKGWTDAQKATLSVEMWRAMSFHWNLVLFSYRRFINSGGKEAIPACILHSLESLNFKHKTYALRIRLLLDVQVGWKASRMDLVKLPEGTTFENVIKEPALLLWVTPLGKIIMLQVSLC